MITDKSSLSVQIPEGLPFTCVLGKTPKHTSGMALKSLVNKMMSQLIGALEAQVASSEGTFSAKSFGFNFLFHKEWVMVIPLTQPFMTIKDVRHYHLPWNAMNLFTLPILPKMWPDSKDIQDKNFNSRFIDFTKIKMLL